MHLRVYDQLIRCPARATEIRPLLTPHVFADTGTIMRAGVKKSSLNSAIYDLKR